MVDEVKTKVAKRQIYHHVSDTELTKNVEVSSSIVSSEKTYSSEVVKTVTLPAEKQKKDDNVNTMSDPNNTYSRKTIETMFELHQEKYTRQLDNAVNAIQTSIKDGFNGFNTKVDQIENNLNTKVGDIKSDIKVINNNSNWIKDLFFFGFIPLGLALLAIGVTVLVMVVQLKVSTSPELNTRDGSYNGVQPINQQVQKKIDGHQGRVPSNP